MTQSGAKFPGRALNDSELDGVAGGEINIVPQLMRDLYHAAIWVRDNINNIEKVNFSVQYNTTGRGDNSGCTGNKC